MTKKYLTFRRMLRAGLVFGMLGPPIGAIALVIGLEAFVMFGGGSSFLGFGLLPFVLLGSYPFGIIPSVVTGLLTGLIAARVRGRNLLFVAAGVGLFVSGGFGLFVDNLSAGAVHRPILGVAVLFGFAGMVASLVVSVGTDSIDQPEAITTTQGEDRGYG